VDSTHLLASLTSPADLALLFFLALLVFGGKKLPEIGRSVGTGIREFRDTLSRDGALKGAVTELQEIKEAVSPREAASRFLLGPEADAQLADSEPDSQDPGE
jgi:sec-independent protein translocase protein TatA